jgi:hypothetical protein
MGDAGQLEGEGGRWTLSEVLGVDGPYSFPEKLLQQIWLRREFDGRRAVTTDGRRVSIVFAGRWNLLGGPDFREARLFLDGESIQGDIEVHLHASDWGAHGHSKDPAYANVVLHVVLFPTNDLTTSGFNGSAIPILQLLPLLYHDLEEYAADAAVAALANRPSVRILESLGALGSEARVRLLQRHAESRWREKVRFARMRIDRSGWEGACHQTALEILGYRYNRVPMLRVATVHPLPEWAEETFDVESVFAEGEGWQRQGVRPANRPLGRLRQYRRWVRAAPGWPDRLRDQVRTLPAIAGVPGTDTASVRRAHSFQMRRSAWAAALCGGAIGGSRFDTLVCDGFLPLAVAEGVLDAAAAGGWWSHWFEGDVPGYLHAGLRDLASTGDRRSVACHGLVQGLLGWLLQEEKSGFSPPSRDV